MKSFLIYPVLSLLLFSSCSSTSENKKAYSGTAIGAVAGGALGAILGDTKGAIIGAGLGGVAGAYAGGRMDKQAEELSRIAETKRTDEGLVAKLKGDILFDTGKSILKSDAKNNLTQMAQIMKKYPENILSINGHTDNTGSSRINDSLSKARAEAVASYLISQGLPSNIITSKGYGSSFPIASNDSSSGRQQNRRVEIEVSVDETKIPRQ